MSKITVRFYIWHYIPIYSGAVNALEKLINNLNRDKYEIEVLTTHIKGHKRVEYINGIKIIRVGYGVFGSDGILNFKGKFLFMLGSFYYNLINRKYDIIHFIGAGKISLPVIFLAKTQGKQMINKITRVGDDDPETMGKTRLGKLVNRALSTNTSHLIISPQILEICKRQKNWNIESFYLIPNPVEMIYRKWLDLKLRRDNYKNANKTRFLFAGVLAKHKGLDVLLTLWEEYNFNAELIICGVEMPSGGSDELIKRINKCENVTWLGRLNKEDLREQYLSCDAFLFPSLVEGLPNVVLEAMSLGILCIANLIVGVTDYLLNEERGIVIDNNSIDSWKMEIEKVIEKDECQQRMTKNAFDWVLENADAMKVAREIEDLYQRIA